MADELLRQTDRKSDEKADKEGAAEGAATKLLDDALTGGFPGAGVGDGSGAGFPGGGLPEMQIQGADRVDPAARSKTTLDAEGRKRLEKPDGTVEQSLGGGAKHIEQGNGLVLDQVVAGRGATFNITFPDGASIKSRMTLGKDADRGEATITRAGGPEVKGKVSLDRVDNALIYNFEDGSQVTVRRDNGQANRFDNGGFWTTYDTLKPEADGSLRFDGGSRSFAAFADGAVEVKCDGTSLRMQKDGSFSVTEANGQTKHFGAYDKNPLGPQPDGGTWIGYKDGTKVVTYEDRTGYVLSDGTTLVRLKDKPRSIQLVEKPMVFK